MISLLFCSLSLAAPIFGRRVEPPAAPEEVPVEEVEVEPELTDSTWSPRPGSLYDPGRMSAMTGMSSHSRKVGELVTVIVEDVLSSEVVASTNTAATGATSFGVTSAFGLETQITDANDSMGGKISLGLEKGTSHDGSGSTVRSNKVSTIVTCSVVGVRPNGNLLIRGSKNITVNGERQFVTMVGEIQPRDIASDNTILSWKISDLHFEGTGRGVVADKQKVGWAQRIVDNVAP